MEICTLVLVPNYDVHSGLLKLSSMVQWGGGWRGVHGCGMGGVDGCSRGRVDGCGRKE